MVCFFTTITGDVEKCRFNCDIMGICLKMVGIPPPKMKDGDLMVYKRRFHDDSWCFSSTTNGDIWWVNSG